MELERLASLCADGLGYLEQDPVAHELLLSLHARLPSPSGARWWVLREGGEVQGVMLVRPPAAAIYAGMGQGATRVMSQALRPFLAGLAAVHAPLALISSIQESLGLESAGLCSELRIAKAMTLPSVPGTLIVADLSHLPLLEAWAANFCKAQPLWTRGVDSMRHWVEQGRVYLWLDPDSTPVAMAVHNRETRWGACLGMVDSDPEHRGRGYAKAVTAHAAQALLGQGYAQVFLQSQANRPRLGAMYEQLGFELSHQMVSWHRGEGEWPQKGTGSRDC